MAAVENETELRVDVGSVNGRVFINNASVGFYGSMVQDPQNRSRRAAVTSRYGRRAIRGQLHSRDRWLSIGPRVVVPGKVSTILLSNNAYSAGVAPGAALHPDWTRQCFGCVCCGSTRAQRPHFCVWRGTLATLLSGRIQVAA